MSWATSSISTAGLLHIIYSGGGRLSAAACHLALFLFMGGLLCPIPAAGTDSKQRIRPGVVCIKGGRPSSPCWGPQDDHIYSILEPLVGHALQRRHARAGGVDNSPFDLLVRRDWRLARRPARRGLRQVEREAAEQKGCNQPVCGQNSAILQPGISHFPTPLLTSRLGVWPYKFLLAIRHAHYLYSPPSDPILLLVLAAMRMPAADAYPNDFHVRYPRRWSLASGPVGREMDERPILTDHGISGVSMPARRPLRSSFPHGKQTLTETIPRPSCVCDDWA